MSIEAILITNDDFNPIAAGHDTVRHNYVSTSLARFTLHKSIITDYSTYFNLSDVLKARVVGVVHNGTVVGLPEDMAVMPVGGTDYSDLLKLMIGIRHRTPVVLGGADMAGLVIDKMKVTHTVVVPGLPGVSFGRAIKGTQGNIYLREDGCLDKVM